MALTQILALVDEVLETGRTPELVCAECPELLPEVRCRLAAYRLLENRLDEFFADPVGSEETPAALFARVPLTLPGYEIVSLLGRGGMGVVLLARHNELNRHVAVKLLQAGPYAGSLERERFQLEAKSLASMRHANIVSVYDVGESNGYPYFTMEYIAGGTLADRNRAGPKSHGEAARIVRTLADAIDHAHNCGIIHRDLKPANILLDADGRLKVGDFGIARSSHIAHAITLDGARMGTPSYMAPEQIRGAVGEIGPATDVYALGAILYELLTGRPPFIGESHAETERQVLSEEPVQPSRLNPKTPRDLDTICLACLRKVPAHRYATAAALRADLDRFLTNRPVLARRVGLPERAAKWVRRHPARTTVGFTLGFVLFLLLALLLWMQRLERAQEAASMAREVRARQLIESAVTHIAELRGQQRWSEATRTVEGARTHLPDARSPELEQRLAQAVDDLNLAQELDTIRRSFPTPGDNGLHYEPGFLAYQRVFERLGVGYDVPAHEAAECVRKAAVRDDLVVALDNAAFAAHVKLHAEMEHLLEVSRLAAPDPWGDRFRLPETWRNAPLLIDLAGEGLAAPVSPPPHQMLILGALLWELGETTAAIDTLRDIQRRYPTDYWVNLELGHALRLSDRYHDAAQYYRAAVVTQPDNAAAWAFLGVTLRRAGQAEEAALACRRAVELDPQFRLAWNHLIYQLAALARFEESDAAFETAIKANPTHTAYFSEVRCNTLLLRARDHASRCEWADAARSYRGSLGAHSWTSSDPWFEYAATSILAGMSEVFVNVRQDAVERANDGTLRAYIAARVCTLAPLSDDLLRNVSALSANELTDWGTRHWSLAEQGAILVRLGRAEDALPLLEQSIAVEPRAGATVIGSCWLAIAHSTLGNAEQSAVWRGKVQAYMDGLGGRMPEDADRQGLHLHNWLEAWVLLHELEAHER